jgi:hypothetical protein
MSLQWSVEDQTESALHQAILAMLLNQASFNYGAPFSIPVSVSQPNTPDYGRIVLTFLINGQNIAFAVSVNVVQMNISAGAA